MRESPVRPYWVSNTALGAQHQFSTDRRTAAGSGVGRLVQPRRALGKDLAAGLGDPDRMLEMGGERAVAGDRGPAVVEHLHVGTAEGDHRLAGGENSGLELRPRARACGV